MRFRLPSSALVLGVALTLGAPTVQALPIQIVLSGITTVDGTGFAAPPGTPIDLDLFVDDSTPDEDGTAGVYHATNPGTAHAFLIVDVTGTVTDVDANSTTGDWSASGVLSALGVFALPVTVTLQGVGLTPDQILPDFTPGTFSGEVVVDVTSLGGLIALTGPEVRADVIGITFVPEPALSALVAMAGLGLAAAGRRRRIYP